LFDHGWMHYEEATEHWSVESKWYDGTSVRSVPDRHVLRIVVRAHHHDSGWRPGDNGYEYRTVSTSRPYVPSPGAPGCHPGEAGAAMRPARAPVAPDNVLYPAMAASGDHLEAHVPFFVQSQSTSLTVMVHSSITASRRPIGDPNSEELIQDNRWWTRHDLSVTKIPVDATAVTTRKLFAVPNQDGAVPGDPNGRLRHVGFPHWTYKGGLFVGVIADDNPAKDRSGTARIQGRFQTTIDDSHRLMVLSMASPGRWTAPGAHGHLEVGLYFPRADSQNLGVDVGSMNWENRWAIAPKGEHGAWREFNETPFSVVRFTHESPDKEYANFPMPKFYPPYQLPEAYGETAKSMFALCAPEESPYPPTQSWRYFASDEFEGEHASGFEADSRPRIWTVRMASVTSWGAQ
jgi:hypothetical protein